MSPSTPITLPTAPGIAMSGHRISSLKCFDNYETMGSSFLIVNFVLLTIEVN